MKPHILVLPLLLLLAPGSYLQAAEDKPFSASATKTASKPRAAAKTSQAGSATAENRSGPDLRIGVLDLERVARESEYFKARVSEVQEEIKALAGTVDTKVLELRRMEENYRRQRSLLSDAERKSREDEMRTRREELEELQFKARQLSKRTEDEVIEPALEEILTETQRLAAELRYDLVLRADTVLFVSKRADLTDAVIVSLDRKLEAAQK